LVKVSSLRAEAFENELILSLYFLKAVQYTLLTMVEGERVRHVYSLSKDLQGNRSKIGIPETLKYLFLRTSDL
jgi:hypothetical protein